MNTTHGTRRLRNLSIVISLGVVLLTGATGLTGSSSTAYAATSTSASDSASTSVADQVIATGLKYQGVRYEYGAESGDSSSFDCSSFTQFIFEQNGITLPRSSKDQSTTGTFVPKNELQPGDLIFFYSPIHHVAVYMGNGKILHTYGEDGVTITALDTGWWDSHYTTARRVLPANGQAVSDSGSATPDTLSPASPSADSSQDQTIGDAWDWLNSIK